MAFIPAGLTWDRFALRFLVEPDVDVVVPLTDANSGCRRCLKPFLRGMAPWPLVTRMHHPPKKGRRWLPGGGTQPMPPTRHYKFGLYHDRCLPPNVTAALPGRSRLAPPDAGTSLRKQHEPVLGGQQP
jgi:hypothetical protein